ncbi:MAG: MarR family transcriptional regulator [Gammaproteobacteria bacterium]|nr:MAG: MarR family transcriptional regulator [Gammaproteobacteria bacterium]RLA59386.1 MAG: MarR family transcriptional regulator [Gammaproteobacteria bacterium]
MASNPPVPVELDNRIFFRLFQAANLMHKHGARALADLGVTTQQWSVLGALSRNQITQEEGMSVGGLSEYLMVSRQSLNGTLNRIEAAGLIDRVVDKNDARARKIRLSSEGIKRWELLQPLIKRFYSDALMGISTQERESILHCLNLLRDNMSSLEH